MTDQRPVLQNENDCAKDFCVEVLASPFFCKPIRSHPVPGMDGNAPFILGLSPAPEADAALVTDDVLAVAVFILGAV